MRLLCLLRRLLLILLLLLLLLLPLLLFLFLLRLLNPLMQIGFEKLSCCQEGFRKVFSILGECLIHGSTD